MTIHFAAVHESGFGTSRHFRSGRSMSAFRAFPTSMTVTTAANGCSYLSVNKPQVRLKSLHPSQHTNFPRSQRMARAGVGD